MAEELIQRKQLLRKLENVDDDDWLKASEKLGLVLTQPKGGTSHVAIRLPGFEISDIRGLVTTVHGNMCKQTNVKVLKRFINCGIDEDAVWRALSLLE